MSILSIIKKQTTRAINVFKRRFTKNLVDVFRSDLIPQVVDNIMKAYDEELVSGEPKRDPARPSVARQAFRELLIRDLNTTLKQNEDFISLAAGKLTDLGLGTQPYTYEYLKSLPKNPDPLAWIGFYINGLAGSFAFLTEENYKILIDAGKIPPRNEAKFPTWGWYGQGFLVKRQAYFARGFNEVIPYLSVRHPYSGARPARLFERALEGIDISELAREAARRTIQ